MLSSFNKAIFSLGKVWTYLRVVEQENLSFKDEIDVVMPTGAMGNLASGYIAKRMGLPFAKLGAGCNINDITHRTMSTGKFHKSDAMLRTLSEALNIQLVRLWMFPSDDSIP